ncbi:hypothetical protein K439DRAFT_1664746 [Ramaria rubella]|nr:hypothetical protein K439DRAFT_1664746 [Ramaria rubella]
MEEGGNRETSVSSEDIVSTASSAEHPLKRLRSTSCSDRSHTDPLDEREEQPGGVDIDMQRESDFRGEEEDLCDDPGDFGAGYEDFGARDDSTDEELTSELSDPPASSEASDADHNSDFHDEASISGSKREGDSNMSHPPSPRGAPVQRENELAGLPEGFVSVVPELVRSLEFIHALEAATLKNGDLQGHALDTLCHPRECLLNIDESAEMYSLKQYITTLSSPHHTYTDFRENHNEFFPESPMLSLDQLKHKIAEWSGVEVVIHDMCPRTCIAYTGPYKNMESCPTCEMYHGSEYLDACERKDILRTDSVFMGSMDGAQLYQDKQSDFWILIWILMDLGEDVQYKKSHVLLAAVIPGPNNPGDMDSFFFPSYHHISALQRDPEGLCIWNAIDDTVFKSRLFFFMSTADGLGSVHFICLVGHHGAYPCHLFCRLKGRWKPGMGFYYAALLKPDQYDVSNCNHPDVPVEAIQGSSCANYSTKLTYILKARNISNFRECRKDTGISGPPLYLGLPMERRLSLTGALAGDSMHAPTLNIGDLMVPLW